MNLSYLRPDRSFEDVSEALEGVPEGSAVLVDLDGTLLPAESRPQEVSGDVLDQLHSIPGPKCVATNRIRDREFDPGKVEECFEVPVVESDYTKPSREYFEDALDLLGVQDAVMIGDSPVMDIYGANRAGLTTYQVEHDRSEYDDLPTYLGKKIEDTVQGVALKLQGEDYP